MKRFLQKILFAIIIMPSVVLNTNAETFEFCASGITTSEIQDYLNWGYWSETQYMTCNYYQDQTYYSYVNNGTTTCGGSYYDSSCEGESLGVGEWEIIYSASCYNGGGSN